MSQALVYRIGDHRTRMRSLLRYSDVTNVRLWLIERGVSPAEANRQVLEAIRHQTSAHYRPEWSTWFRD